MRVKDVMTPDVICVDANEPVLKAARLMLQRRISGLPVLDKEGELVGIVTEGDFLRRGELGTQRRRPKWLEFIVGPGRLAQEYTHSAGRKVEEIMTPDPWTIAEGDRLEAVVDAMERHHVKRLPVTRGGRMVGIVSRANLIQALATFRRRALEPRPVADVELREMVVSRLKSEPWVRPNLLNVTVTDGTVDLWGVVASAVEKQALRVAVETVPHVKAVNDNVIVRPVARP